MRQRACAFSSPCPLPLAAPRPTGKCVLGLAATPPSVVLGRSLKCADARQHEPRGCTARSASPTPAFGGATAPSAPPRPRSIQNSTFIIQNWAAQPPPLRLRASAGRPAFPRPCPGAKRLPDHGPRTAAQRPDGGEAARLRAPCLPFKIQHSSFKIQHSKFGAPAAPSPVG